MNKYQTPTTRITLLLLVLSFAWTVTQAQGPSHAISLSAVQYRLNRLAPGQTSGQAVFLIDQSNVITIEIIASLGDLNTSILGPAGQVIDPTTIDGLGGSFTTIDGAAPDSPLILLSASPGFHYVYSFPWLGAGNYTVRFQAAPTLATEVAVSTQVMIDSHIGAALIATDPTLVLGSTAVLTAAIFDGSNPVAGATVAVKILPDSGPPVDLTLRDDGTAGDNAAGDGLYSGQFTPSTTGTYRASAVITGTSAGISFTRNAATLFAVIAQNSSLTGTFADQGIDDNGDGRFDRIAIDLQTNTTHAGTYRAFIHLKTANGQKLVRSNETNLTAGPGNVRVNFEAAAFLQLGEDGPYNIELVELLFVDTAGASPSDSLADIGQTKAYLLSQFQRPLIALTGNISDQGVDDNGNGKFDRLLVSVQIDVLTSGFYSWGYKLSDANAAEIDFASGRSFFNSGLNQLSVSFNGTKIGSHGVDGPYQLRDLLLQGPSTSLVVTDIGRTQPYRVTQFEGAIVNLPPVANAGADQMVECISHSGTPVMLDGSASSDPNGDTLTYEWRNAAGNVVGTTAKVNLALPLGVHNFTLTVKDGNGGTASDNVLITVRDTTPPTLQVSLSPTSIWPPNHNLITITADIQAGDLCDSSPTVSLVSITSNEPDNGLGDGDTSNDIQEATFGTDDRTFLLRAERSALGTGRVYVICYSATDSSGNITRVCSRVIVPISQKN
jgi:hypothetical protein